MPREFGAICSDEWCRAEVHVDVLFRRIDRSLWTFEGAVPARIIQDKRELLARDDCLSFWKFDQDQPTWEDDAILSMMGSRVDTIFAASLDIAAFAASNIVLVCNPGTTKFAAINPCHRDAVQITARQLAEVAELIASSLWQDRVFEWRRERVLEALARAVGERRLAKIDQLESGLKSALREHS